MWYIEHFGRILHLFAFDGEFVVTDFASDQQLGHQILEVLNFG